MAGHCNIPYSGVSFQRKDLDILKERLKPLVRKEDQVLFFKLQERGQGTLVKKWIQVLGKEIIEEESTVFII